MTAPSAGYVHAQVYAHWRERYPRSLLCRRDRIAMALTARVVAQAYGCLAGIAWADA